VWIICASYLVSVPNASADSKTIVVVKSGATVPFAGVLYSTKAHALLVSRTKTQDDRHKLKCDLQLGKLRVKLAVNSRLKQIELDAEKAAHLATKTLHKQSSSLLLGELKKSKTTPWYKSGAFMFTMGAIATVALGSLAVWAVSELRK